MVYMNQKNKLIIVGLGGLVVGFLIHVLIFTSVGSFHHKNMHGRYDGRASIDSHFIEQMIPHHEGAVLMSQVVLERSKNAEVKKLATDIISAQQGEITTMKKWQNEWFADIGRNTHAHMGMDMMGDGSSNNDVETLKNASDVDVEFVRLMIPHHEMAIMMARMALDLADHEELRVLASHIIDSQEKEIELMRSWLASWGK
jgi:uncharacterized protein (DUF305 family)